MTRDDLLIIREQRKTTQRIIFGVLAGCVIVVGGVLLIVERFWSRVQETPAKILAELREQSEVADRGQAAAVAKAKRAPKLAAEPPMRALPEKEPSEEQKVVKAVRARLKELADTTSGGDELATYDADGRWIVRGNGVATNGDIVFWNVRCTVRAVNGKTDVKVEELTVGGVKYTLPNK